MKIIAFLKNIPRKLILRWLRSTGYSAYFADYSFRKRYDDIFKHKNATFSQKVWAQKRGFLSSRISLYGLNENNYKDYLADFDYYRMHPINGAYSQWIDDKLTTKYILQPFSEYLPEYYYHIYHGEILRLIDCPDGYQQTIQGLINLLTAKVYLAAKYVSGSSGEGFFKLTYGKDGYFINNQQSSERGLEELFHNWLETGNEEYIITEYIHAHHDLQKYYDESPSTLRIMVVREQECPARILATYIKFGTKKSGIINNQVSGAVSCMVDLKSGCFSSGWMTWMTDNYFSKVEWLIHPDSKIPLQGELPHWQRIKEKIIQISDSIPQVRYMGYDVIITEDGFKILEINSHQGIELIQYVHPFLRDEMSRKFFNKLLEEMKNRSKK